MVNIVFSISAKDYFSFLKIFWIILTTIKTLKVSGPKKSIGIIYSNNVKKKPLFKYFLKNIGNCFYPYFIWNKFTLKEFVLVYYIHFSWSWNFCKYTSLKDTWMMILPVFSNYSFNEYKFKTFLLWFRKEKHVSHMFVG